MKAIFATILLLFTANFVRAQHTVSGLITDKADYSLLLDEVTVFIPEFDRIDESKAGGTYILRNIGIGTMHIEFMKEGYETIVRTLNTNDSATVLNIEMSKRIDNNHSIAATTFNSALPKNSPFSIYQFDANRLRRMGNPKLVTSLSYVPGVDVITIGQISRPVIRGLSGSHVLMIQSDSRILSNRLDERYDYELLDDGTSEVEIVKGPASLIYGDNAMGGVMIFRDEKLPPLGYVTGDVNLSFYTNTLGIKTDAGVKGTSQNGFFYSVRLGGMSHTSYIQGEGFEKEKNTEVRKYAYNSGSISADAKGIFGISRKWGESKLTATYWKKQSELIQSFTDAEIDTIDFEKERDRKTLSPFIGQESVLLSASNTILVNRSSIKVNISWQSYSRNTTSSTAALNYDVKFTSEPEKKSGFIIGTQGYFQNRDYTTFYSIYKNKLLSNSLYLLYRYDTEKINFLAGARYDSKKVTTPTTTEDKTYNLVNGSAGVAWHPTYGITIKINGASGNSVPDEERYYSSRMYYGYLTANDVTDETNYEGDLGFEWSSPSVTINADGFYNKISDYSFVDTLFLLTGTDEYLLKQADATIVGGETNISLHPQSLQWLVVNLGYAMQQGKFDLSKLYVPNIPANKIISSVRFQSQRMNYLFNPYIEVMMRNYMQQKNVYVNEFATPSYTLLDFRLGGSFHWGLQTFDITVAINNILDATYYSHLSLTSKMSPVPVADMGRNVCLSLRFPFGIKTAK